MTLIRMSNPEYQLPRRPEDDHYEVYYFMQKLHNEFGTLLGKVPRACKMATGASFNRRNLMLCTFRDG